MSCAGLAPALTLAERAGLAALVDQHLCLLGEGGANARLKVPALIGGMLAEADSIDDMDLLRYCGMHRLFVGVRAPSTLGIFLRTFTFGHVRQLDAVAARFLTVLARSTRSCPAPSRSCTSTSTTRSRPPTDTETGKGVGTATPGSRD